MISVEKGYKYEICISEKRTEVIGSVISGWVEDKTTGKKVGVF